MNPNLSEMSRDELRRYVLANRHDMEAMRLLFKARPGMQRYPTLVDENGHLIEENVHIMESAIAQRLDANNTNAQEER